MVARGDRGPGRSSRGLPGRLPAVVMHGHRDPVIPISHAALMADALDKRPGAAPCRLVTYEGGFHVPMDDFPDAFSRDLGDFLAGAS